MEWNPDALRARFCHALSEVYKSEVPLYSDLTDIVWKADAQAVRANQGAGGQDIVDPDDILPSSNRVGRHGAIQLGTAYELSTIRRIFAIMGMFPVGYYDLSVAGFPMHATERSRCVESTSVSRVHDVTEDGPADGDDAGAGSKGPEAEECLHEPAGRAY